MNKKIAKIKVIDLLAEVINSRDVVDVLEDAIRHTDAKSVILDLSDIKFISRSAAHSLLSMKDKLEFQSDKVISFENAIDDVREMLRIVSANKAYPKEEKPKFNPKNIDISDLLREAAV